MEGLRHWWAGRTLREQRLLLVMFVLVGIVLAWLLVVRPLGDALEAQKSRHAEAVSTLAQARARAEAARRLQGERTGAAPSPVDAFLSRTASEAGFTDARIAGDGPARATIGIDSARPQAFFGWVRLMERSGLAVESLQARTNPDRTLAVEAAFRAG